MMAKVSSSSASGHAGSGGGGGKGGDAGNGLHLDLGHQFAHDAGQVAEGGEGGGIAFDQEDEVAAFGEQRHGLLGGPRPGLGQDVGVARHREDQFDRIGRHGEAAALDDGQRVGRFLGLLHRVEPAGAGLQGGPGAAGDQVGVAGAEGGADQFSVVFLVQSWVVPCLR